MSEIPQELKYTKSHEWVQSNQDGSVTVGITDHAQDLMGDMVYVDLPEVGAKLEVGQDCAVVESVKAASDVYTPVSGEIVEVNAAVIDNPDMLNKDPYGEGWMFRLEPSNAADLDGLMDADAYNELVESEAQ